MQLSTYLHLFPRKLHLVQINHITQSKERGALYGAKIYWRIEILSIFLINITRSANDHHWLICNYLIRQILIEKLTQQIKFIMKCTMISINNLSHVKIR